VLGDMGQRAQSTSTLVPLPFLDNWESAARLGLGATIAVAEPAWEPNSALPGSSQALPEAKVDETRSTGNCGAPR
jgi:hypothetical protein